MSDKAKTDRPAPTSEGRRAFLKGAALAPAAVAGAALGGGAAQAAEQEAPSSLGLRKTEHVKKYLDSARF